MAEDVVAKAKLEVSGSIDASAKKAADFIKGTTFTKKNISALNRYNKSLEKVSKTADFSGKRGGSSLVIGSKQTDIAKTRLNKIQALGTAISNPNLVKTRTDAEISSNARLIKMRLADNQRRMESRKMAISAHKERMEQFNKRNSAWGQLKKKTAAYTGTSRTLDHTTKKLTATNMSFLGIMFGMMGVMNVTSRLMGAVFSPLGNLSGMFETLGLSIAFGSAEMDGLDPANMVKAWMAFTGVVADVKLALLGLAVTIFTDPVLFPKIQESVQGFVNLMQDPSTAQSVGNLAIMMVDLVTVGADMLLWLADVSAEFPNATKTMMQLAALSIVILPVLSFVTSLLSILSTLGVIGGAGAATASVAGVTTGAGAAAGGLAAAMAASASAAAAVIGAVLVGLAAIAFTFIRVVDKIHAIGGIGDFLRSERLEGTTLFGIGEKGLGGLGAFLTGDTGYAQRANREFLDRQVVETTVNVDSKPLFIQKDVSDILTNNTAVT